MIFRHTCVVYLMNNRLFFNLLFNQNTFPSKGQFVVLRGRSGPPLDSASVPLLILFMAFVGFYTIIY